MGFMVIRYTIIILRYTILYNVGCIMRETLIEPTSANIKYMIFRYKIDAGNIKYVKICKMSQ